MLLSDSEITALRADLDSMLPDSGQVGRYTRAPDGGGGFTETWPTVATFPCRLTRIATRASSSGVIRTVGGRLNDDTTHMIAFVAGADVRLRDHVTITSTVYEVLAVRSGGAWELGRHVEVKQVPT